MSALASRDPAVDACFDAPAEEMDISSTDFLEMYDVLVRMVQAVDDGWPFLLPLELDKPTKDARQILRVCKQKRDALMGSLA